MKGRLKYWVLETLMASAEVWIVIWLALRHHRYGSIIVLARYTLIILGLLIITMGRSGEAPRLTLVERKRYPLISG